MPQPDAKVNKNDHKAFAESVVKNAFKPEDVKSTTHDKGRIKIKLKC